MKAPSGDALTALPGDKIDYLDNDLIVSGLVKTCLWQPAPKGGKIYSYELDSGEIVPNLNVVKVHKPEIDDDDSEGYF